MCAGITDDAEVHKYGKPVFTTTKKTQLSAYAVSRRRIVKFSQHKNLKWPNKGKN